MNLDFSGKTAIVTGAAHGFGRAISLAFAKRGASVWVCDVVEDELLATRKLCAEIGGTCTARAVDVRDKDAIERFVADAAAATGHVAILVNNAGGVLGQVGRPLEEVTPAQWQDIFAVNVTGAFYFSQAVSPGMKTARGGRIVNISSGAGLGISLTGIQAYASAKAAQIGLTRQLAHELDVIEKTGLAEFFLICWDIMRFARSRGIPAQGRGSAADSIVAYVLGITRVDPIRHHLLFERFINEGRTSYPDVDIDFSSARREEVIQYVLSLIHISEPTRPY